MDIRVQQRNILTPHEIKNKNLFHIHIQIMINKPSSQFLSTLTDKE